ncbi:MAG: cytochrome c-type biogenesis protein CcmH [Rhodospirillales bacterium]
MLLVLALLTAPSPALAVNPSEVLSDPALEARAREISKDLRCLVCQNQSIDDSDAELARDLRVLVRERLKAGDADDQVIGYIVSRYGDFVLLDPPFKASTYVLWIGPGVVFLGGVLALIAFFRRRARAAETNSEAPPLSPEEKRRLDDLMNEADRS